MDHPHESKNNRILIIDDNESIHQDFRKILSSKESSNELDDLAANLFGGAAPSGPTDHLNPYHLEFASQGLEGVQKVKRALESDSPYALAFVDMRMPPGWDGLETIEHLWKVDPNLLVIICTAHSDYSWEQIITRLGQTDKLLILKKPFDNVEVSQLAIALTEKWNLGLYAHMKEAQLEGMVEERTHDLQSARDELYIANKIKTQFLANMSHEIRTPMNGIIGFADILLDEDVTEEQRDSIMYIKKSADKLMGIVDQILDLSKIESQSITLDSIDFDLNMLLTDVATTYLQKSAKKPILFEIKPVNLPRVVHGDPTRLRQILTHLLNNAFKFTEKGSIKVHARALEESPGHTVIEFRIEDTGIGIPKEQHRLIFESFRQADESNTRKFGGTGLGLSISRKLGELMEGKLEVESTPGVGSCFTFTLRLQKAETRSNSVAPLKEDELTGINVLLIDHNPVTLAVNTRLVQDAGMVPSGYERLESAVDFLNNAITKPALALIAIENTSPETLMPLEALRTSTTLSTIPMVAMVESPVPGSAKICHTHGFRGYLPKPIKKLPLIDVIRNVLGTSDHPPFIITRHSAKESAIQNIQILLVEENELKRELSLQLLKQLGAQVSISNETEMLTGQAIGGNYDLILVDLDSAYSSSLDAASRLRENNYSGAIIGLTSNITQINLDACLSAGMNTCMERPLQKETILQAIRSWCTS